MACKRATNKKGYHRRANIRADEKDEKQAVRTTYKVNAVEENKAG